MRICCVECRLPGCNICFFGLNPPRSLEDFPEQIQTQIYRYAYICSDEVTVIEGLCLAGECVEAAEQNDYAEEAEREPGTIRLEARFEDKRVTADTLSTQSAMEPDIRD